MSYSPRCKQLPSDQPYSFYCFRREVPVNRLPCERRTFANRWCGFQLYVLKNCLFRRKIIGPTNKMLILGCERQTTRHLVRLKWLDVKCTGLVWTWRSQSPSQVGSFPLNSFQKPRHLSPRRNAL